VLTGLAELCFCLLPTNFVRFSVLSCLHILCSGSGGGGGGGDSSSNMGSMCMVEVVLLKGVGPAIVLTNPSVQSVNRGRHKPFTSLHTKPDMHSE